MHWEGRHAPHAIGIVGATALDAEPAAVTPVRAPRVSSDPVLGAVGGDAPAGERDDVVYACLAVVGDDASAIPVFQRVSVDAAADWAARKNFLRKE